MLAERQPVSAGMAFRFGKLCGNDPELWIDLQRAYDLNAAERDPADEMVKIPSLTAA